MSEQRLPKPERLEIVDVDVADLRKSPGNKRPDNERQSLRISLAIDNFQLGLPQCSFRDGCYWVIDGWTRVNGARLAGMAAIKVLVAHGYTEADDALAFDLLNTQRTRPSAGAEFWSRIDYGHPVATGVLRVCVERGISVLEVGGGGLPSGSAALRPTSTRAYGALQEIAGRHGLDVLADTLDVIRAAWPDDSRALESKAIWWVGSFIGLYRVHPSWRLGRMEVALRDTSFTSINARVKTLEGAIGSMTTTPANEGAWGGKSPRSVILGAYNRGLRSKQLPEASSSDLKRRSLGQNPWADEA